MTGQDHQSVNSFGAPKLCAPPRSLRLRVKGKASSDCAVPAQGGGIPQTFGSQPGRYSRFQSFCASGLPMMCPFLGSMFSIELVR